MKLFRSRTSDTRKNGGVLSRLHKKRSRGIKKDESMRSLMTDISSDVSTGFPDPVDIGSLSCPKHHHDPEMEDERQDATLVQDVSEVRMEPSSSGRVPNDENNEHQNTQAEPNSVVNSLNSLFCFGNTPLPQITEDATITNNLDAACRNEQPIKESIECIYNESSRMAMIYPVSELCSETMQPTNIDQQSSRDDNNNRRVARDVPVYPLPPNDSQLWPQAPLLFRVAPNSGTEILGIRLDNDKSYLWTPQSSQPWWKLVSGSGTIQDNQEDRTKAMMDQGCWILPINDGTEAIGESLVIDFQSRLFRGSLLIRLRDAPQMMPSANSSKGYFDANPILRFQVTVRGKFRQSVQWSNLLTGLRMQRKLGKVPSKWMLWTILKVVHFFAPQLQTKLDGDQPYALSPLGSAPRTVTVSAQEPTDLLGVFDREEPTVPQESLTGKAYPIKDPLERARARKKDFDLKFQAKNENFCTGVGNTYTFQFLQHLLDYHTSSIDLGSFHHGMNGILGGQPFQVMAEHNGEPLWMFEIWNESMLSH